MLPVSEPREVLLDLPAGDRLARRPGGPLAGRV